MIVMMMVKVTIAITMNTPLIGTPVGTTTALYSAHGSNFDTEISYPEGRFSWFSSLPSQNDGVIPQIR
jgi:hypothetical protein